MIPDSLANTSKINATAADGQRTDQIFTNSSAKIRAHKPVTMSTDVTCAFEIEMRSKKCADSEKLIPLFQSNHCRNLKKQIPTEIEFNPMLENLTMRINHMINTGKKVLEYPPYLFQNSDINFIEVYHEDFIQTMNSLNLDIRNNLVRESIDRENITALNTKIEELSKHAFLNCCDLIEGTSKKFNPNKLTEYLTPEYRNDIQNFILSYQSFAVNFWHYIKKIKLCAFIFEALVDYSNITENKSTQLQANQVEFHNQKVENINTSQQHETKQCELDTENDHTQFIPEVCSISLASSPRTAPHSDSRSTIFEFSNSASIRLRPADHAPPQRKVKKIHPQAKQQSMASPFEMKQAQISFDSTCQNENQIITGEPAEQINNQAYESSDDWQISFQNWKEKRKTKYKMKD